MIVHVMPLYSCNLSCSYCYLGSLRRDKHVLSPKLLDSKLKTIKEIEQVNIYGGEITLLSRNEIKSYIEVISKYTDNISVVTNLFDYEKLLGFPIKISTSYNTERDSNDIVFQKTLLLDTPIDVTVVVTPSIIRTNLDLLLKKLSHFNSISFLQYFPSVENDLWKLKNKSYESFLISILKYNNNYITNLNELYDVAYHQYSPLMSTHIFINPYGQLCSVFHNKDKEYFKTWNNLSEYERACEREQEEYYLKCSSCKFYLRCYAEHLNLNWEEGDTCCGMYRTCESAENLYKNNRIL